MSHQIENWMYLIGQLFLIPTLAAIALLFFYSLYAFGGFAMAWQQRRTNPLLSLVPDNGITRGYPLLALVRARPELVGDARDLAAHQLLEVPRVVTRVMPMLGLVATMIPMGPALKSISTGDIAAVANSLAVAFSAVILALIASSLTYWIVSVRKRWMAEELVWLQSHSSPTPASQSPA